MLQALWNLLWPLLREVLVWGWLPKVARRAWAASTRIGASLRELNWSRSRALDPLSKAVLSRDEGRLRELLASGARKRGAEGEAQEALLVALAKGSVGCVQAILETHTRLINSPIAGHTPMSAAAAGTTPLHVAVMFGQPRCAEALLRLGAQLEARIEKTGKTPLIYAAMLGKTSCVKVLLESGARIEAKDNLGTTALENAMCTPHTDCVQLLQKAASWRPMARLVLESLEALQQQSSLGATAEEQAAWRAWLTAAVAALYLSMRRAKQAAGSVCRIEVQWRQVLQPSRFVHAWSNSTAALQGAFALQPGKTFRLVVVVSQECTAVAELALELPLDAKNVFGGRRLEDATAGVRTACAAAEAGEFAGRTTACNCCGAGGVKLRACNGCRRGYYCSRECQTQHWEAHKPLCAALA